MNGIVTSNPKPPSRPGKPESGSAKESGKMIVMQKEDGLDEIQVILSIEDSKQLRERLYVSKKAIDSEFFVLAGLLTRAFDLGAHKDWGYQTWKEYVEVELGMSVRKAQYLMQLWQWFALKIKDPSVRQKVKEIGWTKAKELVGICNEDNVDEWVEIAAQSSVKDLAEKVKDAFSDSKRDILDKEEPRRSFSVVLVGEQWENVQRAMTIAEEVTGSNKKGHLLDLIATDFVTNNVFPNNPDDATIIRYLAKFESLLGVRIIAVDKESLVVAFGEDTLRAILQAAPSDDNDHV